MMTGNVSERQESTRVFVAVVALAAVIADPVLPASEIEFARDVQPILQAHCLKCHDSQREENGLRVDKRQSLLAGGSSEQAAVVPGDVEKSYLIRLVSGSDPDLFMPPEGDRLDSREIDLLRQWVTQGANMPDQWRATAADTPPHWSLQPIGHPAPPATDSPWPTNSVDQFVLARLRDHDLEPSAAADRATLIRRLYLLMHGLPPPPQQIEAFVNNPDEGAWPRLVDQVLASSHYGERWAQHWLDIVGYAETDGFEGNEPRANFWHYRDYVIESFNNDKPYDQFVREQIAGDSLGADVATGFLVCGAYDNVKSPDIVLTLNQRQDELATMINTIGTSLLGLTLGCARCHNHRFDPITQEDYYSLLAVLAGVRHGERSVQMESRAEGTPLVAGMAYAGRFENPSATHLLYRGDPLQQREEVSPGSIEALEGFRLPADTAEQQRRLRLAEWLTAKQNPLTARVIVNRYWQHIFGTGLVDTPSDFGRAGTSPSHPLLLDWLATELMQSNWSLKQLARQILLSSTFRQASAPRAVALQIDGDSRLLWRFPPHRLEAEAIRDSILAISGALNLRSGGPGYLGFDLLVKVDREFVAKTSYGTEDWRRMVYMTKVRQEQESVFGVFDCPDGSQVVARRSRSTTPMQALNLANSIFVLEQARLMAERAEQDAGEAADEQIRYAYQLAFGRPPADDELEDSRLLVRNHGLAILCRALFNANEFLFVP